MFSNTMIHVLGDELHAPRPARYHVRGRVISSDGINGVGCDRHRKEEWQNDCEDRAVFHHRVRS